MSLVQAVVTKKFVLVCADTRAVKPNNEIRDNINKLVKVNRKTILGCTGGMNDNLYLFNGFCNLSNEYGLLKLDEDVDISYLDFKKIITHRFIKMQQIHGDPNSNTKFSIMSIICGHNGNEFEAVSFCMTPELCDPEGIFTWECPNNFPYKYVSAGKTEHKNEFQRIANRYYNAGIYDFTTILQYKNILRGVFENGSKKDQSINNKTVFERILLKDTI